MAPGYDDMERAELVRTEIARLGERHCLILLSMAVVVRYHDGSVTLDGEPFVSAPKFHGNPFANVLASLASHTAVDWSRRGFLDTGQAASCS